MAYSAFLTQIKELVPLIDIQENVSLDGYTTFRIGGPADLLIVPHSINVLGQVILALNDFAIPWMVLGNGSNLLIRDKGVRGAVILIEKNMNEILVEGEVVTAQAGVLLSKLSKIIQRESLSGFEFASGIPGTLGGGIYMNAGAYDGEMKDVVEWVKAVNNSGILRLFSKEELDFGYRHSYFQDEKWIIVQAQLRLHKGDQLVIDEKIKDFTNRRVTKQPIEKASAGSTFKRPVGYFAGKLIMDAGLSGTSVGDAQVSTKHCGFIVNNKAATADEVLALIHLVQEKVKNASGVDLVPEIKIIGEE